MISTACFAHAMEAVRGMEKEIGTEMNIEKRIKMKVDGKADRRKSGRSATCTRRKRHKEIALVTGASSGIGKEFAVQIPRLYRNLDEIWLVARRTKRLQELQEKLEGTVAVRIFDGDLQRDYLYERIGKALERETPTVRLLVNAAGYGKMGTASEIESKDQCGMVELNCKALTRMTLLCLPYIKAGGRIVNVASAAAFAPQPGFAVYAASKAYVYSFSEGIGAELASRGISVTAVCPGPVDTEFFDHSGSLPRSTKSSLRAEPGKVVRLALMDAVKRKHVSVYGAPMKCSRILAKFLPVQCVTAVMRKVNHIE